MPHLVQLDHDGAALWLGFLGVDFGEALDPGLHAGRRHPEQLGGAVHRQPAQVEEHRRDLDPERHAARRRVGEVQPAGPAAVALLAAHEPVLDVLLAPAPLAPQRHPFTPSATPPPMDMGNLCGVETLVAFTSRAPDLVAGSHNKTLEVFARDLEAKTTTLVSRATGGGDPDNISAGPSLTA